MSSMSRWMVPLALALTCTTARAQSVAAVLMVEDDGWGPRQELTERLGIQLYGELLQAGLYDKVTRIQGRENANARLAQAICDLAATHDLVDVWLSVHTTHRDPAEMLQLIPASRRKLRLVYSTACHGDQEERKAWEVLKPKALVTHVGINNPLFALPYILSRWIQGDPIGPAVSMGWRETQLGMSFALSLPGADAAQLPEVSGSRPVVSGDRGVTITSFTNRHAAGIPVDLQWSTGRGGPIGLALRTLARPGFEVHGHQVRAMADSVVLPSVLPPQALAQLNSIKVTTPSRGQLELEIGSAMELPANGVTLMLSPVIKLWPGKMDVAARRVEVNVEGVWAKRGILRAKIKTLTLSPAAHGYQATARIGVFGLIPWSYSFDVGGTTPPALSLSSPIFRAIDPALPAGTGFGTVLAGINH